MNFRFSERPYLRKLRGGMVKGKHEPSATGLNAHARAHTHTGYEKMLKTVFAQGVLASREEQERPSS